MGSVDAIASRALGYPYPRPQSSFVYVAGGTGQWEDLSGPVARARSAESLLLETPEQTVHPCLRGDDHVLGRRRTAVLAIGSNASPQQLARKYSGDDWSPIPVLKAALSGYDIVYSPLISSYGSVCATLVASDDTRHTTVEVFITMLDDQQLRRMHETEGGYWVVRLLHVADRLRIIPDTTSSESSPDSAWRWPESIPVLAYNSRNGVAIFDGMPIAFAEIPAIGRTLPALTQREMQAKLMRIVEAGGESSEDLQDLENFVTSNVRHRTTRVRREAVLLQYREVPKSDGVWESVEDEIAGILATARHC
jgi:hypothetical protein